MMPFVDDQALDAHLNDVRTNTTALHLCTAEPADFAGAIATSIANKAAPPIALPSDHPAGGRQIIIQAFADGVTTADGTAAAYALVDATNSRLKLAGPLSINRQILATDPAFEWSDLPYRAPDAVLAP